MEQEIKIDRQELALDILMKFNEFRKEKKYCDFKIVAGDKTMDVHKCVVAANSEYFNAMLSADDNREGVVVIRDKDPECVEKCVKFMYTGKACISQEKQKDLMHLAHMFQLPKLCNGIACFLEEKLDCHTFFHTRVIAERFECTDLINRCRKFALEKFCDVMQMNSFKDLECEYLVSLLSSDDLKESDAIKCKALMAWIMHKPERASAAMDLMQKINFMNIPISYRMYLMESVPPVFNNAKCARHVLRSVMRTQNITSSDFSSAGQLGIILFDTSSKMLKRFNVEDRNLTDMQLMTTSMKNTCSAVLLDDFIYAFVWDHSMHRIRYQEENASWENLAAPDISYGVALAFEGSIYITDHRNYNTSVERYNPIQNNWSTLPAKKMKCYGASLVATCGRLYVIGGYNGTALSTVESYKLSSATWQDAPSTNEARYQSSAVAMDGTIYIFGGSSSSMERYRHDGEAWEIVALSNFNRISFSSWPHCGKIYLIGGNQSGKKTIDEFDPKTNIITRIFELDGITINSYSSVAVVM